MVINFMELSEPESVNQNAALRNFRLKQSLPVQLHLFGLFSSPFL